MNNFAEFRKSAADMAGIFPTDLNTFNKAVKGSADFSERMSKVAIEAAEKNIEISTEWTRETLNRLRKVSQARENPADYARALNEFASESADSASQHISALAEIAKDVHKDAVEVFLDAGKESQREAAKVFEESADDTPKTAKKATKST
ncbi:MAG: phasin family protein [Albidovulum sp.]|nr:phasin family protein [Albidovulum sp.]MDE0532276.1 phasin family protein [Albidovulum sp.]